LPNKTAILNHLTPPRVTHHLTFSRTEENLGSNRKY
jgi:hypothetical protein